jgi:hypothetical protein
MTGTDPLAGARAVARLLDTAGRIPGTRIRFGLDPILGLVPGLGDVAGAVATVYVILVGARLGAPRSVIVRMVLNVAVDTIVGMVPVLGDVFDVGWKANVRNVALLADYAADPAPTAAASRGVVLVAIAGVALLAAAGIALAVVVVRFLIHAL